MRRFLPVLTLLLGGYVFLWAGDTLILEPAGVGEFFFPGTDSVPRGMTAGEELVLDFGSWHMVLEPGFAHSGRTLVQLYFDSRLMDGYPSASLVGAGGEASGEGRIFSRAWQGGTLTFSPLKPDSLVLLTGEREEIYPDVLPPGILLFFEAGGNFFWLGNGTDFYCYERSGRCLEKYSLSRTALSAASGGEGYLYLNYPDGTIMALSSSTMGKEREDRTFGAAELIMSCYEEAAFLISEEYPEERASFSVWVLNKADALYRENPLDRELGAFLRSLRN